MRLWERDATISPSTGVPKISTTMGGVSGSAGIISGNMARVAYADERSTINEPGTPTAYPVFLRRRFKAQYSANGIVILRVAVFFVDSTTVEDDDCAFDAHERIVENSLNFPDRPTQYFTDTPGPPPVAAEPVIKARSCTALERGERGRLIGRGR